MAYDKGQSGNPKGRPKGVKNKLPAAVKEDMVWVYEQHGGRNGVLRWTKSSNRNLAVFYQWFVAKLLPSVTSIVGEEKGQTQFKPLNVIVNSNGDGGPKPDGEAK